MYREQCMRHLGFGLAPKLKRGTSEGHKMAYLNLRPTYSGLLERAELVPGS